MRWIPFTNENIPNIHCMFYLFWGKIIWKLCQRIECHMIDSIWLSVYIQYTQHGSYNSFKGNITNAESRMNKVFGCSCWNQMAASEKWNDASFHPCSFCLAKGYDIPTKTEKNYLKRDKKLVAKGIVNEMKRVVFGL